MSFLNTPVSVNGLELKNRLVMPPMATAKSAPDGKVTEEILKYYDEKSRGGYIGLIIIEHSYISVEGKASGGQLSVSEDGDTDGLKRLSDVIHRNGCRAFMQINHAGIAAKPEITGCPVIGPGPTRAPLSGDSAEAMTKGDIARVTDAFAAAALRVKLAGFDGVELHSAHRYLLNQFYSPLSNSRADEYGAASMEDRLRFHIEVIRAVRDAVGDGYPVAMRLGACDYRDGGSTLSDAALAAAILERAGVDMLSISGGFCGFMHPTRKEPGYFSDASEAVKKSVSIPVVLTGGVTEAGQAEALLGGQKADLIGVGRAILNDSHWAERAVRTLG